MSVRVRLFFNVKRTEKLCSMTMKRKEFDLYDVGDEGAFQCATIRDSLFCG